MNLDPVIVHLTINRETIETTPEHPFYTEAGEWVYAGSLLPGDEIRTAAWGVGTVEAIHFTPAPQTMYNLTVATAHTYFVGEGQWLVHNCDWWLSGDFVKVVDDRLPLEGGPIWGAIANYGADGNLKQIALYDEFGEVIYHIDAPDGSLTWHYHEFTPGNPQMGHGTGANHIEISDLEQFLRDMGFDPGEVLSP